MNDQLIERYLDGTATEAERREVEAWFAAKGEELPQPYSGDESRTEHAQERTLAILEQRIGQTRVVPLRKRVYRYAVAASVLLAVCTGAYFALKPKPVQLAANKPLLPGTNVALLKTGRGHVIALNGANGLLATFGKTQVTKTGDALAYKGDAENNIIVYDTLQVPAGGRPYHLQLGDGSRIVLNAATTLRFPEHMSAAQRGQLELISGEIYAEIVHNPKAPLAIQTPQQLIEDIGTKFDVSAYPDDAAARTTLVEGAVKVNHHLLSPGQQAVSAAGELKVEQADVALNTAWVNGLFRFRHTPLRDILREVARWYDVKVVYQGNAGNDTYSGIIGRDASLQRMLSLIGAGDVHYRIEGRELIILP